MPIDFDLKPKTQLSLMNVSLLKTGEQITAKCLERMTELAHDLKLEVWELLVLEAAVLHRHSRFLQAWDSGRVNCKGNTTNSPKIANHSHLAILFGSCSRSVVFWFGCQCYQELLAFA